MRYDFTKPNARTLEQIDGFFQAHPTLEGQWERRGAPMYYRRDLDGWGAHEKQDPIQLGKAFYAALDFMRNHNITEEEVVAY